MTCGTGLHPGNRTLNRRSRGCGAAVPVAACSRLSGGRSGITGKKKKTSHAEA